MITIGIPAPTPVMTPQALAELEMKNRKIGDPCYHLSGHWIRRRVNFRCYECGFQVWLDTTPPLPKGVKRDIEVWEGL